MRVCVDTTILIDILKDEFPVFQEKLYEAIREKHRLVSPALVYGELMPQFGGDGKQVSAFLTDHKIIIEPLDIAAVEAASKSWLKYLQRKEKQTCPHCSRILTQRAHFLADFLVGGFAMAKCDAILTRDRGIYNKYFPGLTGYADCLKSKI